MSGWFKFGGGDDQDRRFVAFEEKTIDEQADEITKSLIMDEENPIFTFDHQDRTARRELYKSGLACSITLGLVTMIDLKVLNTTQYGRALGPLRKFAALNVINLPIYWYYYHDITSKYMDLKKHCVTRYLIDGDEILYKRRLE